jgi:hypothetical protein
MSLLPFPADSAEFEEYTSVMNAMADEAEASAPDPEPHDCSSDELRASDDSHWENYWANLHEREDNPEDRYLDCMYEDQHEISEYGMEGCCGDF